VRPKAQKGHWGCRAGFTLIELIVTLLLMGVVMVLAARVLGTSLNMWINTEDDAEERADQVAALERMVREVRGADAITQCTDTTLSLERNGSALTFEASGGALSLEGESLCSTAWGDSEPELKPELCECAPHHLIHLSLSAEGSPREVSTHVYPRNTVCP